ncbi:MAG TPA: hypothetical protein VL088_04105 [Pedobacter sp.]|nr:hypothetical protein [Pedobacter sp.]
MLIETYNYDGKGYNPYLIRDSWQVAKLNYIAGQGMTDIVKIDKHVYTDEAFILIKGLAILIEAEKDEDTFSFQCLIMKPGITYNIPAGTWHNIAMDTDAEVIIVEKSNTHLNDCVYVPLLKDELLDLYNTIELTLQTKIDHHNECK